MKKDFFEIIEEFEYPSTILFRSIELSLIKQSLNKYFRNKKILDLGCGDGIAASAIFKYKIYYGLDYDKKALEKAYNKNIYKKIILGKGEKIDLKNNSIDLVFSNCTLEHIAKINKTFEEVRRILKKDGKFIFTTPSNNYKDWNIFSVFRISFLASYYGKIRDKKFEHYNCHDLEEWKKFLEKFGFRIQESFYYIDKKTMEFWDFLWLTQYILKKFGLMNWFYNKFWKKKIFDIYKKSKTVKYGAGICIVAEKI